MTAAKTIAKILKLKFLKIVDVQFRRDGTLILNVKPLRTVRAAARVAAVASSCAVARRHASGETCRWQVGRSFCAISRARLRVPLTAEARRRSLGLRVTPV